MAPSKDRRLFERIVASFKMRFLDFEANKVNLADVCDVSAGGVGFISKVVLAPKTPLGMWLDIPDGDVPFYATGWVVWSETISADMHRIGVRLEKPELMGLSRILKLNQDFV